MMRDARIATTVLLLGLGLACLAVVIYSCVGKKAGTRIGGAEVNYVDS